MKCARYCLSVFVILMLIFVSALPASAQLENGFTNKQNVLSSLWTVDDDGPADFSNISQALAVAVSGDTIFVYPGIYEEHSLVVNESISLIGSGAHQTVLVGENRADVLLVYADEVLIENLSVESTFRAVISNNCTGLSVVGCNFIEVFDGIYLDQGSDAQVKDCGFLNCTNGVYVGRSLNVVIENSSFIGCSKGLYFEESDEGNIASNRFESNEIGVYSSYAQTNSFSKNSFVNNTRDVLAIVLFYEGRLWKNNIWHNNYWDNWVGLGVKVIWSALVVPINSIPIFLPWMQIDWNPAKEPF